MVQVVQDPNDSTDIESEEDEASLNLDLNQPFQSLQENLNQPRQRKARLSEVSLSEAPSSDSELEIERGRKRYLQNPIIMGAATMVGGPGGHGILGAQRQEHQQSSSTEPIIIEQEEEINAINILCFGPNVISGRSLIAVCAILVVIQFILYFYIF